MKWTDQAWKAVQPIFHHTCQHPFIQELMAGTLAKEKFLFYIEQDGIYLASYGKLLTGLATRLENPAHRRAFISFAGDNMDQERELHQTFIQTIDPNVQATPTCLLYTTTLLHHLAVSPVEVALAAVMPCFVVYMQVGKYIYENQPKEGNNPYQAWIDTYADGEHVQSVIDALQVCNEVAQKCTPEQQQAMLDAYITSARIEHLFWDSAYQLEQWKV